MKLIYKNYISADDYNLIREEIGWGKLCDEQAQQGLDHSAYVVSCYDGENIAGSARIIWDRGYISYLADVMVRPAYQGRGIGRHLVEMAKGFMKSQLKENWKIKMVLIATEGKEGFYKKLAFKERPRPNEDVGAGMDLWFQ